MHILGKKDRLGPTSDRLYLAEVGHFYFENKLKTKEMSQKTDLPDFLEILLRKKISDKKISGRISLKNSDKSVEMPKCCEYKPKTKIYRPTSKFTSRSKLVRSRTLK